MKTIRSSGIKSKVSSTAKYNFWSFFNILGLDIRDSVDRLVIVEEDEPSGMQTKPSRSLSE